MEFSWLSFALGAAAVVVVGFVALMWAAIAMYKKQQAEKKKN